MFFLLPSQLASSELVMPSPDYTIFMSDILVTVSNYKAITESLSLAMTWVNDMTAFIAWCLSQVA